MLKLRSRVAMAICVAATASAVASGCQTLRAKRPVPTGGGFQRSAGEEESSSNLVDPSGPLATPSPYIEHPPDFSYDHPPDTPVLKAPLVLPGTAGGVGAQKPKSPDMVVPMKPTDSGFQKPKAPPGVLPDLPPLPTPPKGAQPQPKGPALPPMTSRPPIPGGGTLR